MVAAGNGGSAAAASSQARQKRKTRAVVEDSSGPHAAAAAPNTFLTRLSVTLCQKAVRRAYLNSKVQVFIAGLIMGNFFTNVVEKQIDPWNNVYGADVWYLVETVWNVVFIIELLWNMYGCFYLRCTPPARRAGPPALPSGPTTTTTRPRTHTHTHTHTHTYTHTHTRSASYALSHAAIRSCGLS